MVGSQSTREKQIRQRDGFRVQAWALYAGEPGGARNCLDPLFKSSLALETWAVLTGDGCGLSCFLFCFVSAVQEIVET